MLVKEENDKHYVYLHFKAKSHTIFYVGKGKDNRYKSKSGRNKHWFNTANKNGWYSKIIKSNISEKESLELEELLIDTIGLSNLCNQNYFNGGMSGYTHSEEAKVKMSISKKGRTPWNKGTKSEATSLRMRGTNHHFYGKKKTFTISQIESIKEKNGTPVCDAYTGVFYPSLAEMSRAIGITRKTKNFDKRVLL
jgi:hypothetical protein